MEDEDAVIRRVSARADRVSRSDPIVIRGTGQTYFEVLPLYISHDTTADELSLKLKYRKQVKGNMKI